MSAVTTLQTMARLLAVVACLQSFEFLALSLATGDEGIWRWSDLEPTLGRWLRPFLGGTGFRTLNVIRLILAIVVLIEPHPAALLALLVLHVLTLMRWLGSFNGGSDAMISLLLWTTTLALFFPRTLTTLTLWYVSFQLVSSYFRAGWAKIKTQNWRSGRALSLFLSAAEYESSAWVDKLKRSSRLLQLGAWLVLLFELSFPLSLLDDRFALFYMGLGLAFHLVNAYAFGLNRFLFAWLAAYPALYYCSGSWNLS